VNLRELVRMRPSRKQHIVDAAIRLMAEGGPEALTASALAKAAGISKATLFHHFGSLDDIVLASFDRYMMSLQSVSGPLPASLREWLLALGAEAAESVARDTQLANAYFGFVMRAKTEPRLRARLAGIAAGAETAFYDIIRQLAPALGEDEAHRLAALVLVAGDGLALHHDLFPQRAAAVDGGWRALVDLVAPEEMKR